MCVSVCVCVCVRTSERECLRVWGGVYVLGLEGLGETFVWAKDIYTSFFIAAGGNEELNGLNVLHYNKCVLFSSGQRLAVLLAESHAYSTRHIHLHKRAHV